MRIWNVLYIGDSKYYKETTSLSPNSIFKQHTYARNIVQKEIDWFYGSEQEQKKYLNYRDEETEGYNITPNFFVSGKVDKSYLTTKSYLRNTGEEFPIAYQFKNRLFDKIGRNKLSISSVYPSYKNTITNLINSFKLILPLKK